MTAPDPIRARLDELAALRAAIGDSPVFNVVSFEQDENEVLAQFDDGGTSVFAQCYGVDAAALIVAAVNALPGLLAAVRAVADLADHLETRYRGRAEDAGATMAAVQVRDALAAALTTRDGEEGDRG